nr:GrpB family protein [uncultured Aquimarina sp.]
MHHLYVCPKDSTELQRHLLFRNHLRKNESARLKYQNLKYELAEKANQNKKMYATLKEVFATEFINSIIDLEKKA